MNWKEFNENMTELRKENNQDLLKACLKKYAFEYVSAQLFDTWASETDIYQEAQTKDEQVNKQVKESKNEAMLKLEVEAKKRREANMKALSFHIYAD